MVTEKFRRELRQESEKWWSEGLIDAALYEKLGDRYQFRSLEGDASSRFVAILIGLGSVLLGLAAITFVAANWQAWSREFKMLLLLSLFMGVNVAGFYLWRQPASGYHKLGQGLLLLGALILGANLALMSQMFHQSGDLYPLLLIWGFGVMLMAYSLSLTSLGMLSLILVTLGYGLGWLDWASRPEPSLFQLMVQHMPLIASLLFVPLAYRCRSRAIFGFSALLIAVSLMFNLKPLAGWISGGFVASGWMMAIAFILPAALLWSYSRTIWQFSRQPVRSPDAFQPIARSLALWFFSFVLSFFAFHWIWQVPFNAEYQSQIVLIRNGQPLIDAVLLAIVSGIGWLQLRHQHRKFQGAVNSLMVGSMMAIAAMLFIVHFEAYLLPSLAPFAFNVMLFVLAMGLIRDGLAIGSRETFWGGMLLLVSDIISRMLEYDTGLLLKSIVFALCGVSIILAGLWFERNTKRRKPRLTTAHR